MLLNDTRNDKSDLLSHSTELNSSFSSDKGSTRPELISSYFNIEVKNKGSFRSIENNENKYTRNSINMNSLTCYGSKNQTNEHQRAETQFTVYSNRPPKIDSGRSITPSVQQPSFKACFPHLPPKGILPSLPKKKLQIVPSETRSSCTNSRMIDINLNKTAMKQILERIHISNNASDVIKTKHRNLMYRRRRNKLLKPQVSECILML